MPEPPSQADRDHRRARGAGPVDGGPGRDAPAPQRRLVALGASNLHRLLPTLCDRFVAATRGAVEVLCATGLGRSFGVDSRFLGRVLPGIDGCGLWRELAARRRLPATGVVMDVGNDVLYGVDPERIVAWVDRALERLRPHVDRLVLADLPGGLDGVGALRFLWLRALVPSCRLGRAEALRRAEVVREGLAALAAHHRALLVPMPAVRYGFDPIHVRRRFRARLCAELLGPDPAVVALEAEPAPPRPGVVTRWRRAAAIRLAPPALRRVRGRERLAQQPVLARADGLLLSLF